MPPQSWAFSWEKGEKMSVCLQPGWLLADGREPASCLWKGKQCLGSSQTKEGTGLIPVGWEDIRLLGFHHALPHTLKPIPQPRRLQQDGLPHACPPCSSFQSHCACSWPLALCEGAWIKLLPASRQKSCLPAPSSGHKGWFQESGLFQQVKHPKKPSNPVMSELKPFPGTLSMTQGLGTP